VTSFDSFERKMQDATLPRVAIETFRHYYEQLVRGETGRLSDSEIGPVDDLPDAGSLSEFAEAGTRALGATVVIKLNGGLGTSMGMTRAKSLLPAKGGLSFLEIIAHQVRDLRRRHDCALPIVLMNSFRTRDDSLEVLSRFHDLASDLPFDFLQHRVPKILVDGLQPATWPTDPQHEWCPPGHGDIYTALLTSDMLSALRDAGFTYAFVSNSDNLGAVVDLGILGWFAEEDLPFLMEVTDRTEADKKGGHLAQRRNGGLTLREVAQCPPDEIDSFQDIRKYQYFNTNTLWIDLRRLESTLRDRNHVLGLPMIRNEKTLDPTNDRSPRVYQLETAMGAAISVFEGARALRVTRDRFLPVKTTNDLLALWSDAYVMTDDHRVVPASSRRVGDLAIDLDPRHYRRVDQLERQFPRGAPSLAACDSLRVRGDVRFGRDVTIRGRVELEVADGETRTIPDGEVLD
jgi:UTP--glucose-1-phosphate uridylyltransferase